jgi:glycosyltransferase involved in cell wall biosynthesis
MAVLVCFGDYWDDAWRRRQQLMWRLARSELLDGVVYVEQPLTLFSFLKFCFGGGDEDARHRWRRVLRRGFVAKMKPREVYVLTPLTIPLRGSGFLLDLDLKMRHWAEVYLVRWFLKRYGVKDVLLWVSHPFLPLKTPERLGGNLLCYDCTEEFSEFAEYPEYARRRFYIADQSFTRSAKVATVVSDYLEISRRRVRQDVIRIPNGVDIDVFGGDGEGEPADLRHIPRPRLVSIGGINNSYHWELVERLAQTRPEWSLVFIGAVKVEPSLRRRLRRYPSIHFLGRKPYGALAGYLKHIDVCLQLYRPTDANRSRNAQKLLLYLAAGKPVVSTATGDVERLRNHVEVAKTDDVFIELVEQVLRQDTVAARSGRLEEAERHTWSERVRQVEDALRPHLQGVR